MTAFEQELVRAIENGCPKCQNKNFLVYRSQDVYSKVGITDNGRLAHTDVNRQLYYRRRVSCQKCHRDLWTKEHGWIPVLADVVAEVVRGGMMNRREMETILYTIRMLMEMLLPYINPHDREKWSEAIGLAEAVVFETSEEA